jgi:hypothetical protein
LETGVVYQSSSVNPTSKIAFRNFLTTGGFNTSYGLLNEFQPTVNSANMFGLANTFNGRGQKFGVINDYSANDSAVFYGIRNNVSNNGTGIKYGMYNFFRGTGNAQQFGTYNNIFNSGNGDMYGSYTDISAGATGTGAKYGYRAFISVSAGGTQYGFYSNVTKAGSYAGYFNGDVRIGLGDLLMAGNVIPQDNNTYDLGTTTLRWRDAWVQRNAFNGSDIRLKKEVKTTAYGLKEIMKLHPVNYTWKDNDRKDLGFIAQEIREVLPELVMESKDSMNTLLMNYQGVIPVLVKAIQEQQKIIDAQSVSIEKLKADNQSVEELKQAMTEKEKQYNELKEQMAKINQLLGIGFEAKKEK